MWTWIISEPPKKVTFEFSFSVSRTFLLSAFGGRFGKMNGQDTFYGADGRELVGANRVEFENKAKVAQRAAERQRVLGKSALFLHTRKDSHHCHQHHQQHQQQNRHHQLSSSSTYTDFLWSLCALCWSVSVKPAEPAKTDSLKKKV